MCTAQATLDENENLQITNTCTSPLYLQQGQNFKGLKRVWTDPLVLSVLQPCGVVGHTQQRDDEVDQSKDAVEPQKVVPERHKRRNKALL